MVDFCRSEWLLNCDSITLIGGSGLGIVDLLILGSSDCWLRYSLIYDYVVHGVIARAMSGNIGGCVGHIGLGLLLDISVGSVS